jgi:hypothetical protein
VLQASLFVCLAFDPFSCMQDGLAAPILSLIADGVWRIRVALTRSARVGDGATALRHQLHHLALRTSPSTLWAHGCGQFLTVPSVALHMAPTATVPPN